jgi:[ribosomal protein S5]-alanine N-acetyltransferase
MPAHSVVLRPAEPDDAPLLRQWRSEASVRRHQPLAPLTVGQLRAEILSRRHQDLYHGRGDRFDWIILLGEQPVGWITLVVHSWDHGLGECGYALSTPYQGRGIMTRALGLLVEDLFRHTSLYRLEARCATENLASQGVLEKLGFQREGTLRGYFQLNGARVDNVLFGLTRPDWEVPPG